MQIVFDNKQRKKILLRNFSFSLFLDSNGPTYAVPT